MTIKTGERMLASDINDLTFFPKGTILMYDGTDWINGRGGWYICDGQNGTPDLRDKFIMGSSKTGQPKVGGTNFQTLTAANIANHTHTMGQQFQSLYHNGYNWIGAEITQCPSGYARFVNNDKNGQFWHSLVTIPDTGTNGNNLTQSFDNKPSYYALIYIRKCV